MQGVKRLLYRSEASQPLAFLYACRLIAAITVPPVSLPLRRIRARKRHRQAAQGAKSAAAFHASPWRDWRSPPFAIAAGRERKRKPVRAASAPKGAQRFQAMNIPPLDAAAFIRTVLPQAVIFWHFFMPNQLTIPANSVILAMQTVAHLI